MPTTIKLKNSVTTTNAPSSLVQGEVAINITDKKVWVGNAATTPVQLLGDGGSASFTSIAFGAGTVSLPSITFTGDTNTGIYSPAADTIAFTEGGVESMRIDSSGNVLIGTATSLGSERLAILRSSAGEMIRWTDGTLGGYIGTSAAGTRLDSGVALTFGTGGNERMRIDSSGRVGINTSSPTSFLTINTGASAGIHIFRSDANANFDGIVFRNSANNTNQSKIGWNGNDLRFESTGNTLFETNGAERMRILSTGQVLVGATGQDGGNRLMSNNGVNGWPATSGTTQTYGCLRLRGGDNAVLDFGVNSVNTWIQATDLSALNSLYWLFLNPNGGEVIVAGKTDNGAYNLQCNGTGVWGAGAYVNGSDERIKDNIAPLDSGLDVVAKLNPVTYKYKEDWSKDQSTQTGFIAQELLTALEGKNYVDGIVQQGGENQYMSVAYQNIIPILTKAIQEQQAMIEELKQEVAKLKGV